MLFKALFRLGSAHDEQMGDMTGLAKKDKHNGQRALLPHTTLTWTKGRLQTVCAGGTLQARQQTLRQSQAALIWGMCRTD